MGSAAVTEILLDTNAVLWLVAEPGKMASSAMYILENPEYPLFVSAVSAWEIAIKTHIGRLDGTPLLSAWDSTIAALGATQMPVESIDAIEAGCLDWEHRDPFDRMIVAQAARRGLMIATSDSLVIRGALSPVLDTRIGNITR